MQIAAVGRAFPDHYYDQETLVLAIMFMWTGNTNPNIKRVETLHKHVEVGGRHLSIDLGEYLHAKTFGDTNNHFIRVATNVGEGAVNEALERSGVRKEELGAIFMVSVTGIATPSIDALLVNRLDLPKDIKRVPIFGLGCVAGAAGVARAADYVKAYPDQAVLMLSVELCSLTLQKDDFSIANLITTGLFGDGGACAVVVGDELAERLKDRSPGDRPAPGPKVLATRSVFYPDTEQIMGWDISEKGFKIVLSAGVPMVAQRYLPKDIDAFLADNGLERGDIGSWVCHPGGPKVIDGIQRGLELSDDDVLFARKSLKEVGNMSSTSVLMVLRDTMDQRRPEPGTKGIMLAMGPGFCSELVLLQW